MTFIFVCKLKKLFCGKRKNEEIKRKIISVKVKIYQFSFVTHLVLSRDQRGSEIKKGKKEKLHSTVSHRCRRWWESKRV